MPHGTEFLDAARRAGSDCASCHAVEDGPFALARATLDPAVHAAAGFALDAPHAELECAACHDMDGADASAANADQAAVGERFRARHPGRDGADCGACHQDPHAGQFAEAACVDCHTALAFEPHRFDAARHAGLQLALEGSHAVLECGACHAEDGAAMRLFRGTDSRCSACHADAHADFAFASGRAGDCAACHDDVAVVDARAGFEHDVETGFGLVGAHGQADCEACHRAAPEPDATGRRFGHAAASFGLVGAGLAANNCAGCHADVHAGAFAQAESCADCHSLVSFRSGLGAFEHGAATGFALDGQHAELACTACHADGPAAPRGRRLAAGKDCASCHADNHAGQFVDSPRGADCARCHDTAVSFGEPVFRHNFDSDFPLQGRHRELGCASCHTLEDIAGSTVRRYWPVQSDCAACHGIEAGGVMRKRLGRGVNGGLKGGER